MKVKEYLELATLKLEMECNKAEYTYLSFLGKDGYYGEYTEGMICIPGSIITAAINCCKTIINWICDFFKNVYKYIKQLFCKTRNKDPSKLDKIIKIYPFDPQASRDIMKYIDDVVNNPLNPPSVDKYSRPKDVLEDVKLGEAEKWLEYLEPLAKDIRSAIDKYDEKHTELVDKYVSGVEDSGHTVRQVYFKAIEILKRFLLGVQYNIATINKALREVS